MSDDSDKKSDFMPMDKSGALSLMKQAKDAFLAGQRIEDTSQAPTILVSLPIHVANYLITAFGNVKEGQDADSAFGLKKRNGRPSKDARNALISLEFERLEKEGVRWTTRLKILMEQFSLSREGVISAADAGKETADFYKELSDELGDEVAADFLDHLKASAKKV